MDRCYESSRPPYALGVPAAPISRGLYYVLIQKLDGKAFNIVRACDSNGLEAWRLLKREYAGREAGRKTAMLRLLLNPGEEWQRTLSEGKTIIEILMRWEFLVTECETTSGQPVPDDMRVATVIEHLPEPYRTLVRNGHETVRSSYAQIVAFLRSVTQSNKTYTLAQLVGEGDRGGVCALASRGHHSWSGSSTS